MAFNDPFTPVSCKSAVVETVDDEDAGSTSSPDL
jgi:hypothetical protein